MKPGLSNIRLFCSLTRNRQAREQGRNKTGLSSLGVFLVDGGESRVHYSNGPSPTRRRCSFPVRRRLANDASAGETGGNGRREALGGRLARTTFLFSRRGRSVVVPCSRSTTARGPTLGALVSFQSAAPQKLIEFLRTSSKERYKKSCNKCTHRRELSVVPYSIQDVFRAADGRQHRENQTKTGSHPHHVDGLR